MAKSSLISALNERNEKLSTISNAANQVVDEAFESLFGAIPTASHPTRNTDKIPIDPATARAGRRRRDAGVPPSQSAGPACDRASPLDP